MADCSEYLELISRSVDGDLTTEEAEALYEHLAHCPNCSEILSSFEELSMMTSDSIKKPPAQLREGVMTSIKAAKNRPWYARYRFTAVAACFALVVLAISYTPLGNLFSPPQEETILSDQAVESAPMPSTTMRAASPADSETPDTPQTAKSSAPETAAAEESPIAVADETQETDATNAPAYDTVEESTADNSAAEFAPSDVGATTPGFDPSLLPQTPYEKNFAKYLTFSAVEAPAVLHSITSDRTVDHTVYYILTSEQLTAVQSALLEDGIEVQVIPGDPTATESLLILTIAE